jgi:hypothetical protein
MSAPSADPPLPPAQPSNEEKGEGSSSAASAEPKAPSEDTAGDVKMEETKPNEVEDTFEDIPESVLNVRPHAHRRSML